MVTSEVCLFGDSVARGIVLDDGGSYKPIKDYFGALAASELGVSLVNKAQFGCTIAKGRKILNHFLEGKKETRTELPCSAEGTFHTGTSAGKAGAPVRLALLEFGGNDCDFHWDKIAENPKGEHLPATPLEAFSEIYGEMISTLREEGTIPLLMTLPPLDAERYFNWFTRCGLDRTAILSWLGDVQYIYRWHEGYNDAVWEIALEHSCHVVDIRQAFLENKNYQRFLCLDGIHPNREGHRLIEKALIAFAARF